MKNRADVNISISVKGASRSVKATVHYVYTPPCRGLIERGGRQLEPDSPPEIAVINVDLGGVDLVRYLSDQQIEAIENHIAELHKK